MPLPERYDYDASGDYIHTKKQYNMAKEIIDDISWAEEPHSLAEYLGYPVTTVKSFLKKLWDQDIAKTKEIELDGESYVAVDKETGAWLLQPSTNWAAFKKEFQWFKKVRRFL